MAVQYRSASEDCRGTTNPCDPPPPPGTSTGDLLLAVQASDVDGSLGQMEADGWTEVSSSSRSGVGFVKVWQRTATSSEPDTYTFEDATDAQQAVVIVALHGYDPAQPLAVEPTWASGSATGQHPAPSVAGVDGGMLITAHVAGTDGTTRTYSPPNGMTEAKETQLSSGGNLLIGVNYLELTSAAATGTRAAMCSASEPYVTMSLVVAPIGTKTLEPSGITSAEAFGAPTVVVVPPPVLPESIDSAETFGEPVVASASDALTLQPIGISSGEVFGTSPYPGPHLFPGAGTFPGPDMVVSLSSPGNGPFPGPQLFPGPNTFPGVAQDAPIVLTLLPAGVDSAEVFGSLIVETDDGEQFVNVTAIDPLDPADVFGSPTVEVDLPGLSLEPLGIPSAEAFGRPIAMREVPPPVMPTWRETYFIDGVDLMSYAWRIETAEGLQVTPGVVGDDIELPGRDGALQVLGALGQQRRADALGMIIFNLWLKGVDPVTGTVTPHTDEASADEWYQNWDRLVRLFHRRMVTIDHPRPDGSIRRAIAHLLPNESIVPSRSPSSPWFGRFRATFVIPAAHWTDTAAVTTGQQSLTTGSSLSLEAFAAATAPCTELTVTFGEGNNPRLSTSYNHVGWNLVIASGRQLGIDTAAGRTHQASGAAWDPGYAGLTYAPGPRLFEIDPSEALEAVLTHTTGVGAEMAVEVSGKRRYRTS